MTFKQILAKLFDKVNGYTNKTGNGFVFINFNS